MITVRRSRERGHFNHGWLDTYHPFSFGAYYDPNHVHFRTLRVINEDTIQPAQGFGTHSHQDMEIITYVLEGTLEHKDSIGNTSLIQPGEVQRMSAGTGVTHSEFNHSDKEPVHLLQIWIFPNQKELPPSYEQRSFKAHSNKNNLRLLVSQDGRNHSVSLHQDVLIYDCYLEEGKTIEYAVKENRGVWIQVTRGELKVSGQVLKKGDGACIEKQIQMDLATLKTTEFLLFDLR